MSVTINLRGEAPAPKGGEIVWTNANGTREFAGVVQTSLETDLGGDLSYQITAQSYQRWFDRKLVTFYYGQQSADAIVRDIVQRFCPSFTCNNVQASYIVPPFFFNYEQPSKAIQKIADSISWLFYIDENKDVHFEPLEQLTSPLPSNTLNPDTDTTNYSNLQIQYDSSQLKNRIYLKGFQTRMSTPVTLNFTGDGQTMQWSLGYKPSRDAGDVTVTVGGVPLTVKRDLVDGSPNANTTDTSSVYINYSQAMFRLNYAPAQGVPVQVVMYYLSDVVAMREDPIAQKAAAKMDGSGDGVYSYAVTDQSLTNSTMSAANSKGDVLLYQYGYPVITGEFTSFTQGWRPGQMFYLKSARRFGGMNEQMFVQAVKKTIVQATPTSGALIKYDVQIANTPYLVQ